MAKGSTRFSPNDFPLSRSFTLSALLITITVTGWPSRPGQFQ